MTAIEWTDATWRYIGIEREPAYLRIAEARIAYWSGQPVEEAS